MHAMQKQKCRGRAPLLTLRLRTLRAARILPSKQAGEAVYRVRSEAAQHATAQRASRTRHHLLGVYDTDVGAHVAGAPGGRMDAASA